MKYKKHASGYLHKMYGLLLDIYSKCNNIFCESLFFRGQVFRITPVPWKLEAAQEGMLTTQHYPYLMPHSPTYLMF